VKICFMEMFQKTGCFFIQMNPTGESGFLSLIKGRCVRPPTQRGPQDTEPDTPRKQSTIIRHCNKTPPCGVHKKVEKRCQAKKYLITWEKKVKRQKQKFFFWILHGRAVRDGPTQWGPQRPHGPHGPLSPLCPPSTMSTKNGARHSHETPHDIPALQ